MLLYIAKPQRVEASAGWGVRNYTETLYVDDQNGMAYPMFAITQAGSQFLVDRMTGKMAVQLCE